MGSKSRSKSGSERPGSPCYYRLMKDAKVICRTECPNPPTPPIPLSPCWAVDIVKRKSLNGVNDLPKFNLYPKPENSRQILEWNTFLPFLYNYKKVAVVEFNGLKMYILPSEPSSSLCLSDEDLLFPHAVVAYDRKELIVKEVCDTSVDDRQALAGRTMNLLPEMEPLPVNFSSSSPQSHMVPLKSCLKGVRTFELDAHVKGSNSDEKGTCSSISKCYEAVNSAIPIPVKDVSTERNFVRADPSYLKTLGQAHSGWIFGAIAELVDNSRDAKASQLEIAVETIYDKTSASEIPMLSIVDDGEGMNHKEILRMVSFGHKQPDEDDLDRIGRFGVGFKTGSMRLGRDALVLTQTTQTRSIAFLSQTLNEGRDNLEIPIVSYRRHGQCMEFDTSVQSDALAKYNLEAIKEFSPFNEYLIGEKAGLFQHRTGTQIYIWNLDKWGSDYSLEWLPGIPGASTFHQGDILIRSRRVRTRPGQTSRKVPLDYSLRSYLELIFSEPRMKLYVQGSQVKSHPLAKCLNNTDVINEVLMGKPVHLTLGRSQVDLDEGNSGIFLYWHGRLIEAYKRVGGMIHSADMGRGVIGVIDVTELMDDGNGGVWVHSNKQGFQDCEVYACLEEWLGKKADEYWDTFFDAIELEKGKPRRYKPDNEWVQCEKCRKWRMLNADFDSKYLPKDWFCYMKPFNGKCEMPELKPDRGIVTIGTKRSGYSYGMASDDKESIQIGNDSPVSEGKSTEDDPNYTTKDDVEPRPHKRLRRGPRRSYVKK
ncbi:uncharacterized protein LOC141643433 isoform X2 [Silene latifolia]|uniref:uncharacterized protein LOC141643433 isoform X2 n=1 Tax=Silene latifolia TaxID=37657 RepID=UPI003D780C59